MKSQRDLPIFILCPEGYGARGIEVDLGCCIDCFKVLRTEDETSLASIYGVPRNCLLLDPYSLSNNRMNTVIDVILGRKFDIVKGIMGCRNRLRDLGILP